MHQSKNKKAHRKDAITITVKEGHTYRNWKNVQYLIASGHCEEIDCSCYSPADLRCGQKDPPETSYYNGKMMCGDARCYSPPLKREKGSVINKLKSLLLR